VCFNNNPNGLDITLFFSRVALAPLSGGFPNVSSNLAPGLQVSSSGDTISDSSGNILVNNDSAVNTSTPYCATCGLPVNTANGTLFHKLTDFTVQGRTQTSSLSLTRTYMSHPLLKDSDFGPNWISNYETRVLAMDSSSSPNILWVDPSGGGYIFKRNPDKSFQNPAGFFGRLIENSSTYEIDLPHGVKYLFNKDASSKIAGRLVSISEPHGETVSLAYDSSGNLSSVSSPFSGSISYTRDSNSHVTQISRIRDALNYAYNYDSSTKLLTQSADFNGNITAYAYTAGNHYLTSLTDPLGRTLSFQYDAQGRASQQTTYGGATILFSYLGSPSAPITQVKDEDGQLTTYKFNSLDLLTETDLPNGGVKTQTWSPENQVISMTDELGFTSHFTYNSNGDLTSFQKPLDPSPTLMTYDPNFDSILSVSPLAGAKTLNQINPRNGDIMSVTRTGASQSLSLSLTYDSFGHVLGKNNGLSSYSDQTDPNGLRTFIFDSRNPEKRTYDGRSRVLTRSFASGRMLSYTYDNFDRVLQVTDTSGPSVFFTYDVMGRVLSRTLSGGSINQVTQFKWDARDRLIAKIDPALNKTSYVYDFKDSAGNNHVIDQPIQKIDPKGNITTYQYDSMDRLIQVADSKGGITRLTRDLKGNVIQLKDPLGQVTVFRFDGNGRLTARLRPSVVPNSRGRQVASTEETDYFYDLAGKEIREETKSLKSQGELLVKEFHYDDFDRVVEKVLKRVKNGNILKIEDDAHYSYLPILEKNVLTHADNAVEYLGFSAESLPPFMNLGFSVKASDPKNTLNLIEGSYALSLAPTGGILSIQDGKGATLYSKMYDPAGRLLDVLSSFSASFSASFTYDSFGRLVNRKDGNGLKEALSYDGLNRLSSLSWSGSNDSITENLKYDPNGLISEIDQDKFISKMSYDPLNQLTSIQSTKTGLKKFIDWDHDSLPSSLNQTFSYDLAGNRVKSSRSGVSEFLNNAIVSSGDMEIQSDLDGLGALATEGDDHEIRKSFQYRVDGKLAQFQGVSGEDHGRLTVSYFYDALGRRVAKQFLQGNEEYQKFKTQSYAYLDLQDRIFLGKTNQENQTLYIDGNGIDEHLGEISHAGARSYLRDHLGSIIGTTGEKDRIVYGPFGESENMGSTQSEERPVIYGFTGRQFDPESGTYYFRARTYDAELGRFTGKDPSGFNGGDLNLYRYVLNNPMNFADPFGLEMTQAEATAIGIGIGAGIVVGGGIPFAVGGILIDLGAVGTGTFISSFTVPGAILGGAIGGGAGAISAYGAIPGVPGTGINRSNVNEFGIPEILQIGGNSCSLR